MRTQNYIVLSIIALLSTSYAKPPLPPYTDIDLYKALVQDAKDDSSDLSWSSKYQTSTGKKVWDWLIDQKFFREKPEGKILEQKTDVQTRQSGRSEIVVQYRYDDGNEKVAIIFFIEDNTIKFHDIFLFDMKETKFNLYLSDVLENPMKTKAILVSRNIDVEKLAKTSAPFLASLAVKALLKK